MEYKNWYLYNVLNNKNLIKSFQKSDSLPIGYGFRLDARVVEIPWALSRLDTNDEKILDAGSALNTKEIVESPLLSRRKITIVTLAPEKACFWYDGVSYLFGDLRNLDFKAETFDSIVCVSTIEHIGMDNTMYIGKDESSRGNPYDFRIAIDELKRVLKKGGRLFCTFPFGKYENHGWFQQFDSKLTNSLIEQFHPVQKYETIFKYLPEGWIISDRESSSQCQYFDIHKSKYFDKSSAIEYPSDYPAGERAVCCLELIK